LWVDRRQDRCWCPGLTHFKSGRCGVPFFGRVVSVAGAGLAHLVGLIRSLSA